MKKLWMRVGMYLELSDDEIKDILGDEFDEGRMAKLVRDAIESGRAKPDGECYVPEGAIDDFNETYGTHYSLVEAECCL